MKKGGVYHIKGKTYKQLRGARAAVWHGNAYKTTGGLTKNQLVRNKNGRYVSKKKHHTAKREKRLEKAGYFAKKGKFGFIYKGSKKRGRGRRTRRRRRRR